MATLLIDDFRNLKADRVCRTFNEGIDALSEQPWDLLLLDHDLGEEISGNDGYGVANWLERNPQHMPKMIEIVSSNPVGRQNIERVLQKYYHKTHGIWIRD